MTEREHGPNWTHRRLSNSALPDQFELAQPASQIALPPQATAGVPHGPLFAAEVSEDLLTGRRTLHRVLLEAPTRLAAPNAMLVRLDEREPPVILLRNGFAYRSCVLADGGRAILDVLVPGDVTGLDHAVLARPVNEITAANRVTYTTLEPERLRALMADRCVALTVMAQIAEAHWRSDRLTAMIGRLDAEARIAALVLSIHDRRTEPGA